MKLLEICAGSTELSLYAKTKGVKTTTVDIKQFGNIDIVMDAEDIDLGMLLDYDVVWFGTMCTSYSIAACGHHRNENYEPQNDFGIKCDRMNTNIVNLFKEVERINPDFIWYIENPVGILRKMPFMRGLNRTTITYCSYGDTRMKPTDVWSNNIYDMFNLDGWQPRNKCFNGNTKCQHEAAPRGSSTGTQGLKDNHERSKMPKELIEDIINQTILKYERNR
jgi:hypothetical protein|tara:strand:+ start:3792 stop:4454 length:663 start_codon:yes stop_codon:yes gene_type:complete